MRSVNCIAVLPVAGRWLVYLSAILFMAACSSNQSSSPPPPPSMPSGMPSPMPSPPSLPPSSPSPAPSSPSSAPSSPSSAPSSPSPAPSSPSSPGPSAPSGSPPPGGDAGGEGQPSSHEDLPAPGVPPGAPRPGSPGSTDPGAPSGAEGSGTADPSWEQGLPGGGGDGEDGAGDGGDGDDGWQTSNQLPGAGGTSRIPPMPSERDRRRGSAGDEVLDGALEEFDGEILAEREVIRSRSNETAGTGGAGPQQTGGEASGSLPGSETEGGGARTGGVADAPPMPGGASGTSGSRGRSSPQPPSVVGQIPDDIPDARDDDIIARQLREAAMAETDPVLKERLWDEYRRYKGI
jgi:hypothetical protein